MNNTPKNYQRLWPWVMWILAAGFYGYEFFLQVSPAVMVHDLMHAFSINAVAMGIFASVYFYAYAAMQIPVGVLLDRFGARRLLTLAVLTCALGALLFANAHLFSIAILGRLLIGLGSAFACVGCMYTAATWLPIQRFSLLTGIMLTIGMLGAINGQAPLALLVAKFGWRSTMLFLGLIGLIVTALMWSLVRDRRIEDVAPNIDQTKQKLLHGLKQVIQSKQTWLCAIYGGLIFAATSVFGALWGVAFIAVKYHISTPKAATIVSMLFFGWAIGAPIFGGLSDHLKRRKVFLLISALGAFLGLATVIYIPIPHILAGVLLFIFGVFSSGMLIAFSVAREINPPSATGAAIGFMNCLNMLGGAFIPPIVGLILDASKSAHSTHIYSVTSYELALTILPLLLLIAIIIALAIKETYASPLESC